jgi:hypothetical protein
MMLGSPGPAGAAGAPFSVGPAGATADDSAAADGRSLLRRRPEPIVAGTSPSRGRQSAAAAMMSPIRGASKIAPIAPTPISLASSEFGDLNETRDAPAQAAAGGSPAQTHTQGGEGGGDERGGQFTPPKPVGGDGGGGDVAIGDASLSRYLTAPHPPPYGVLAQAWQGSALFGAGLEKAAWLGAAAGGPPGGGALRHAPLWEPEKLLITWAEFAEGAIAGGRSRGAPAAVVLFSGAGGGGGGGGAAAGAPSSVGAWADACQAAARDGDKGGKMMRAVGWTSGAVNRSERAVAVALLKHSGLGDEALGCYERWAERARGGGGGGDDELLTRPVLAAWVAARKVRRWMSTTRAELQADTRVYEKLAPGIEHR